MRDRKETVNARAVMRSATGTCVPSVASTGPVCYGPPASRWRRNGVKVNGCYINLEFLLCLAVSGLIALIPGIILTVVGFKVTCFDDGTCHTNPLMIIGPIVIGIAMLVFIGGVTSYCVLSKKAKRARQQAIQQCVPNSGGQSTAPARNPPYGNGVPVVATTASPSRTNYGFEPDMNTEKPSAPPSYDEIVGRY